MTCLIVPSPLSIIVIIWSGVEIIIQSKKKRKTVKPHFIGHHHHRFGWTKTKKNRSIFPLSIENSFHWNVYCVRNTPHTNECWEKNEFFFAKKKKNSLLFISSTNDEFVVFHHSMFFLLLSGCVPLSSVFCPLSFWLMFFVTVCVCAISFYGSTPYSYGRLNDQPCVSNEWINEESYHHVKLWTMIKCEMSFAIITTVT